MQNCSVLMLLRKGVKHFIQNSAVLQEGSGAFHQVCMLIAPLATFAPQDPPSVFSLKPQLQL